MSQRQPHTSVSFFISIHVPKTAGTTLGNVLSRALARRVLFDYPDFNEYLLPDAQIVENRSFITKYFRGIHGHFGAPRYLRDFGSAKFLATLRHPVDRVISQYVHEYNDPAPTSLWHRPIRSGDLSVIDFAGIEGVGNAMASHLRGMDSSDYDLLLITEHFKTSLHLLNYVIGNLRLPIFYGDPVQIPVENSGAARGSSLTFDEPTRRQIFAKVSEDVSLYVKALEQHERMVRKFLL